MRTFTNSSARPHAFRRFRLLQQALVLAAVACLASLGCGGADDEPAPGAAAEAGGSSTGTSSGVGSGAGGGGTAGGGRAGAAPAADVVVHPAPGDLSSVEHLAESVDYTVTVNGQPSFVYETDDYWKDGHCSQPDKVSFTSFSFEGGAASVVIDCNFPVSSVTIKPTRDDVAFTQNGDRITFTLTEPKQLSVEVNDLKKPLFVFAEEPDEPDLTAEHVFGPGVHHIGTKYPVGEGERVYLAGGAVVEGTLLLGGDDVTISGRGILSGGEWSWDAWTADKKLSLIANDSTSRYHEYRGIIMLNSPGWFVNGGGGNRTLRGLKVIGWNGNTDAPHLHGNGVMEDCFIFNNDDALATSWGGGNDVFRNVVVWNHSWGRPIFSLNSNDKNQQSDVLFKDIDIINCASLPEANRGAMIAMFGDGTSHKQRFVFRNIRIEGPRQAPLIYLQANDFLLENLTLEDVTTETHLPYEGLLASQGGVGSIEGVHFHNLVMGGQVITSLAESHIDTAGNVSDVTFEGP